MSFFKNKHKLNGKSIDGIGLNPVPSTDATRNKIYINESLTAVSKCILKKLGLLVNRKKYYSCYMSNGVVVCQKIKDGSKLRINSLMDCHKIK